jgi:hypothetical protein
MDLRAVVGWTIRNDFHGKRCYDGGVMTSRIQITMEPELQRHLKQRSSAKGVSIAEYVRHLIVRDKGPPVPKPDPSIIFDLVNDGEPTNIARDKDRMIGEAVWDEHLRKTRR